MDILVVVIVVIVVIAKAMMGSNVQRDDGGKDSPLSILKKRYARGEIDQEGGHTCSSGWQGFCWTSQLNK